MPYELGKRLVIGVASSAMFDLTESDTVFRTKGEEEYRKYQSDNIDNPLNKAMSQLRVAWGAPAPPASNVG